MRISDWSSDVCSSDRLLDAVPLRPALRDIGDAAVEEGRLARQARIDGVGAFVRGAAPVAGHDFIALPYQFGPELGVVEIAADDEAAGGRRAHEAVDDILRIARDRKSTV